MRPVRVLAPNPGPFTLGGTNTWIVGTRPSVVIDPGPSSDEHVTAVLREAAPIGAIVLTHRHEDHAGAAPALAAMSGSPVLAFRPRGHENRLRDGEVVAAGNVSLRALHAPGHTADHVVLHEPRSRGLFTGDTVLGRGTSAISPPDGDMAAYLRTLAALRRLEPLVIYPGHGPAVWAAGEKLEEYLQHRADRERQILEGLEEGPRTPAELVPAIYGGYPEEVLAAAAGSVLAHLVKLERQGVVIRVSRPGEARFRLAPKSRCERCGRPVAPRSKFCPNCGLAALQEDPSAPA